MSSRNNNSIVKTSSNSDGILRITLNNPKNHNALSEDMMLNMQLTLDEAAADKKIRVIIISADGPTFSAGHDLKELKAGRKNSDKGKDYFKEVMLKCSKLMQSIVNKGMPKTVSTFFEEMLSSASLSFKLYSELSIGAYNCILQHISI